MSKVIPKDHFKVVCKPGAGADCCRYITASADGICCEKNNPGMKATIDRNLHNMVAQGDNCEGL